MNPGFLTRGGGEATQAAVLTNLSVRERQWRAYAGFQKRDFALSDRLDAIRHRRALERHDLMMLLSGPMRTSELRRSIPEITERMLIRHLHEMVEEGIILRHDRKTVPPYVCYSISPYGMTLAPVLEKICEWGRKHQARVKMK